MKIRWKRISFFALIAIFVIPAYYKADSYFAQTKSNTKTVTVVIDNYSKFKSILNDCIKSQKSKVQFKILGFNESTYNISKTIDLIYDENPNLKHIISDYSYNAKKSKSLASINYDINYIKCDYSVKNVKEFTNVMADSVNKHKEKVVVKVNNFDEIYNIKKVYDMVKNTELPYKYVFGASKISGLTGSKIRAYEINIAYSEKAKIAEEVTKKPDDLKFMYNTIKEAMLEGEKTVVFNMLTTDKFKISFENFNDLVDKVMDENSEVRFFSKWNTSYSMYNKDLTYKVDFQLNYTKSEIKNMQSAVKSKIKEIIASEITPNMSDYTKELKLHDYLVNNAVYDYKNLQNNTLPLTSFTAYGVLIKGVGVCEGYSYAMKMLLNSVGIECSVITGKSNGAHAWNLVKLGSDYYHLDATFDDPVVNNGEINVLRHDYFNLTDKEIKENHSWEITKYPKCNSYVYQYTGSRD